MKLYACYFYSAVISSGKLSATWKLTCLCELGRPIFCPHERHFEADPFKRGGSAFPRQQRGDVGGRVIARGKDPS